MPESPQPRDSSFRLRSQDAHSYFHTVDIFRSGFGANQDHGILLGAVSSLFNCIVGGKDDLTDDCSRGSRQALRGQDVLEPNFFFIQRAT